MVYVMKCFNIPIPDEGGLFYKLKAIGLKVAVSLNCILIIFSVLEFIN